ncbi:glycoside hydrolase family 108 protein [Microvirga sp. 2MCAF38]|uniref:glycoside hydrolase family 108 protein n=1 Tax=Microvirga sp. 2MCAF38 TaxID=3232989 RepID=UPI003F984BDD
MSTTSFDSALRTVLQHEGGFVDHPLDPGGATKFGITRPILSFFRKRAASIDDIRRLTEDEARAIYRRDYWNGIQADALPPGIDLVVFDIAVNSGPKRATLFLQRVLGVPADGFIGPRTLAKAQQANAQVVIRQLSQARLSFLSRLATWRTFGRGWTKRVLAIESDALKLTSLRSTSL